MQNKKTKPVKLWALASFLCAAVIFYSSSVPGEESGAASMSIVYRLQDFIALNPAILHFIVRKAAHFLVFLVLSFCLTNTFRYIWANKKKVILISFGIASVYGILDEFHQYFVPGRVFAVTDMVINAAGALTGTLIAYFIFMRRKSSNMTK